MSAKYLVFLVFVLVVGFVFYFLYRGNPVSTCTYSDSIKENNFTVTSEHPGGDVVGQNAEGDKRYGCHVGITSCMGFTCTVSLYPIGCGETRDTCGDLVKCECE